VLNDTEQTVCDFTLMPHDYFCPKDIVSHEVFLTENTYVIHHFSGSWLSDEKKYAKEFRKKHKRIPRFMALHISGFIAAWKFRGFRAAIKEIGVYFRDRKKQKKRERNAKKQLKK
jgi:hypothetical protein